MVNLTITRAARLAPRPSLPEVLNGKVKLANAITRINGLSLHFLAAQSPAGRLSVPSDPDKIQHGIFWPANEFDLIVVDGAPLGDDTLLAAFAHCVDDIIVVSTGLRDTDPKLEQALMQFGPERRPRGMVVTENSPAPAVSA
ncbi:MAG: hypothetical protein GY778_19600 [bacterium]|nr:hypothetical protein [bacterium]